MGGVAAGKAEEDDATQIKCPYEGILFLSKTYSYRKASMGSSFAAFLAGK